MTGPGAGTATAVCSAGRSAGHRGRTACLREGREETGEAGHAAISRFAWLYADQNERDHAQLVSATAAGAVESLPG